MNQERRLTAIMFTDIVGYSALMARDESLAMEILEKNRRIHKHAIEQHSGRFIKEIGDGTLSVFQSSFEAVNCARAIQMACSAEPGFKLRIGIHSGDVIFKDNDVFGDGVNLASRIESSGEPGGIFFSEKVFDDIRNKKGLHSVFYGERVFKNIPEPVKIYSIFTERKAQEEPPQKEQKDHSKITSIIVLPFVNMSPEPDQEYFSDGLTEEVIADLSQISGIHVISRSSAMTFKGTTKSTKTIAREASVNYLLEGSVRKSGNNLRITAQLIRADSDTHLWAEKYRGTIDDVFDFQEKVSRSIVKNLKIKLLHKEEQKIASRGTKNTAAFTAYLKGRYFYNKRTRDDALKSLKSYEEAIQHDPTFVIAFAGMAEVSLLLGFYGLTSMNEASKKSKAMTLRGLELDDSVSEIQVAMGNVLAWFENNYSKAGMHFRRAVELNPGNAEAHHMYAHYLGAIGQTEASIKEMKLALDLEPLSVNFNTCLGITKFTAKKYDIAIEQLRKVLEMDPDFNQAHYWLGRSLLEIGNVPMAMETLAKACTYPETKDMAEAVIGYVHAVHGREDRAREIVTQLEKKHESGYLDIFFLAFPYTGLKEYERALDCLEKGYHEFSMYLSYLLIDPILKPLHSMKGFSDLAEKMGMYE